MFALRASRILRVVSHTPPIATVTPGRERTTTGLCGLEVHPEPLKALTKLYASTLDLLQMMPSGAVYRQAAESLTKERQSVLETLKGRESENEIKTIEETLGVGLIEEVVLMAEDELKLAGKMLEWKPWEDLETPPAPGQWAPFRNTPSTTTADDLK